MKVKLAIALLLLTFATGNLHGASLKFAGNERPVGISVLRRINLEYRLLTRQRPLEFVLLDSNPGNSQNSGHWLRVYSRIWWPHGAKDPQDYSLSFWCGDSEIKRAEFETRRSRSSYGPNGRSVGEWRSFYVQIPPGRAACRLVLNGGQAETAAIRIAFQAPRPWQPLRLAGLDRLTLKSISRQRDTTGYTFWRVLPDRAVTLPLEGPCRVRIRTRINYDPGMSDDQNYVIVLKDGRQELKRALLRADRSRTGVFVEATDVIPSTERSVYFQIGEEPHAVTLTLTGTLAKSGAVAVEVLPPEKYE